MRLWKWVVAVCLLLVLGATGLFHLSRSVGFQLFGDLIAHGARNAPHIALTLDDGPTPAFTQDVLDILADRGVTATFFLTGEASERRPDLVRLIAEAGHEIGNHSYSHSRMVLKSPQFVRDELARTDRVLRSAGYDGALHFRPPYGKKLFVLPWVLSRQDRLSITWDVDGDGDPALQNDPQAIADHVIENTQNGSIILLHVMFRSRGASRDALPLIIDGLRAKGVQFVTISDLIEPD